MVDFSIRKQPFHESVYARKSNNNSDSFQNVIHFIFKRKREIKNVKKKRKENAKIDNERMIFGNSPIVRRQNSRRCLVTLRLPILIRSRGPPLLKRNNRLIIKVMF